jgi:hypothetical protein
MKGVDNSTKELQETFVPNQELPKNKFSNDEIESVESIPPPNEDSVDVSRSLFFDQNAYANDATVIDNAEANA